MGVGGGDGGGSGGMWGIIKERGFIGCHSPSDRPGVSACIYIHAVYIKYQPKERLVKNIKNPATSTTAQLTHIEHT